MEWSVGDDRMSIVGRKFSEFSLTSDPVIERFWENVPTNSTRDFHVASGFPLLLEWIPPSSGFLENTC